MRISIHLIQYRMLALVALLAVVLFGAVAATQLLVRHQAKVVSSNARAERQRFHGKMLTLMGAQMQSIAFDYTYWDKWSLT